MGVPTVRTDAIVFELLERIADGESLRAICRDEHMPNKATVFRWLAEDAELRDQYARARETQADSIFDEIIEIADDARNDWMENLDSDGVCIGWQLNGDHVQRSRLRIDARKWMAGKLRPKVYGDKVQQEISGPNGGPVQHEEVTRPKLTQDEWLRAHGVGTASRPPE